MTTILLLKLFPATFEWNSLFAPLLAGALPEVGAAILLKMLLIAPLVAVIAWPLTDTGNEVRVKAVKLGVLAGIIALTPFMTCIALRNNLFSLIKLALLSGAA